jgi:AmmeMemoRadiSam system protein A
MKSNLLTPSERIYLLDLARTSIQAAVRKDDLPELEMEKLSPVLRANAATFVTLTVLGSLRGCIGTLEAYQPLAMDVQEHAVAAAIEDPRFPLVTPKEVEGLRIEISRLTTPEPLIYSNPAELPSRLRPGLDGVILRDGYLRATFLPQVWDSLPEPEEFLNQLCWKMHVPAGTWRERMLQVWTYQVEQFHEE